MTTDSLKANHRIEQQLQQLLDLQVTEHDEVAVLQREQHYRKLLQQVSHRKLATTLAEQICLSAAQDLYLHAKAVAEIYLQAIMPGSSYYLDAQLLLAKIYFHQAQWTSEPQVKMASLIASCYHAKEAGAAELLQASQGLLLGLNPLATVFSQQLSQKLVQGEFLPFENALAAYQIQCYLKYMQAYQQQAAVALSDKPVAIKRPGYGS